MKGREEGKGGKGRETIELQGDEGRVTSPL